MCMHGDWMLLGTGESVVQASIDVLDGNAPSLAEDPDVAAAWSRAAHATPHGQPILLQNDPERAGRHRGQFTLSP